MMPTAEILSELKFSNADLSRGEITPNIATANIIEGLRREAAWPQLEFEHARTVFLDCTRFVIKAGFRSGYLGEELDESKTSQFVNDATEMSLLDMYTTDDELTPAVQHLCGTYCTAHVAGQIAKRRKE